MTVIIIFIKKMTTSITTSKYELSNVLLDYCQDFLLSMLLCFFHFLTDLKSKLNLLTSLTRLESWLIGLSYVILKT